MARPITLARFEQLVEEALDGLPAWLAPYLDQVAVQVEDEPPPGEEDVYGFFEGPELGDDAQELRHEVRVTVVHELAHRFGFDERRLDELGFG